MGDARFCSRSFLSSSRCCLLRCVSLKFYFTISSPKLASQLSTAWLVPGHREPLGGWSQDGLLVSLFTYRTGKISFNINWSAHSRFGQKTKETMLASWGKTSPYVGTKPRTFSDYYYKCSGHTMVGNNQTLFGWPHIVQMGTMCVHEV